METFEKITEFLKKNGADEVKVIDPRTIITAPWTVFKCKYGCLLYGQRKCCPPNVQTWKETQEIIDCYHVGILFRMHEEGAITPVAKAAERELFLDGYYKAISFGSGPCEKCKNCNPEKCNFQGKTTPAMEASGIDVFATVRNNGFEIKTLVSMDEVQNHFGLLLID